MGEIINDRRIKKKIKDYYGTAMQFNTIAISNLVNVDNGKNLMKLLRNRRRRYERFWDST